VRRFAGIRVPRGTIAPFPRPSEGEYSLSPLWERGAVFDTYPLITRLLIKGYKFNL
jgi:hypothetical protein